MCKVGDIIVINSYKDGNKMLKKHSFIVMSDKKGEIEGFPYDLITNVMSSFKGEKQKKRKLSYPGNFEIKNNETNTNPNDGKDGYIKTDQLYFFKKSKIKYTRIGTINIETMKAIFEYINNSNYEIVTIIDNLK